MISKIISKKDILFMAILFFITTLIWIGSNVYRATKNSTISEDTSKEIMPIVSTFDTESIKKLKLREKILLNSDLQGINSSSDQPAEASRGGKLTL